jgi:hypothetical protein
MHVCTAACVKTHACVGIGGYRVGIVRRRTPPHRASARACVHTRHANSSRRRTRAHDCTRACMYALPHVPRRARAWVSLGIDIALPRSSSVINFVSTRMVVTGVPREMQPAEPCFSGFCGRSAWHACGYARLRCRDGRENGTVWREGHSRGAATPCALFCITRMGVQGDTAEHVCTKIAICAGGRRTLQGDMTR